MLLILATIQCQSWTEAHLPLSIASLALLATQPDGYYPFQVVNLLGMYRSLGGHIGADLWYRLSYASMHAYLLLANLNAQSREILDDLKDMLLFTQERRLLSIQKVRNVKLEDLKEIPEHNRLSSVAREFKYDINEPLFVLRAIFWLIWRPMIPIYIIDSLLNIASVGSSVLNSRILHIIDLPSEHSWYEGYLMLLLTLFVNILTRQFGRIQSRVNDESDRVRKAIELELFRLPLTNDGLRKQHTIENARRKIRFLLKIRFIWFMFNIMETISNQLSVYIAVYTFTLIGTNSSSSAAATISNADMFQIKMLMDHLLSKVNSLFYGLRSLQQIVKHNYQLEKVLKGDFVNTLPRFPIKPTNQEDLTSNSGASIVLKDCDFVRRSKIPVLRGISLNVKAGELVAVVGKTGSGKSSLLLSVCGEIEKTKGTGAVFGSITLIEQSPWIMNDTVRENILFGRAFDKDRYNRVIEACALTSDIKVWTNGDKTMIGERGINISGGQRARLALARTVYSKADIYVLDDPLSAVDAHVKRVILDNVIMDSGLLGGRIRVVAVNDEKLLPYFHQVVRLDDGRASVTQQEPQEYLTVADKLLAGKKYFNYNDAASDVSSTAAADSFPTSPTIEVGIGNNHRVNNSARSESGSKLDERPKSNKKSITGVNKNNIGLDSSNAHDEVKNNSTSKIHEWNKWDNMRYVLNICGITTLAAMGLSGFVRPIFSFIIDGYKLKFLKSNRHGGNASNDAVLRYMRMSMLETIVRDILCRAENFVKQTAANTHFETRIKSLFIDNLIHAPLSFFDSKTWFDVSREFRKSTESVSRGIPNFVLRELSGILEVVLAVYRVALNAPLLLLSIPLLSYHGNRRVSHFQPLKISLEKVKYDLSATNEKTNSAIRNGQRLIRLLGLEPYFTKQHMEGEDILNKIHIPYCALKELSRLTSSAWGLFSESMFKVCILAQNHLLGHSISSGGLVTFSHLAQTLISNVTRVTELPSRLLSFNEGIDLFRHYLDMDRDDYSSTDAVKPPANWPSAGKIEFRNFSVKYRSDLEYALKDINLTISPGEKIGIVGRTGAGKSSLSRAIFRLISKDTCEGAILIDGRDIFSIHISDLRPKIGTIPQESTLFSGSFKKNLDPLLEYTIEDMWAALVKCNITEFVEPKRDMSKQGGSHHDDYNDEYEEQTKEEIADWDRMWKESGWITRIFLLLFVEKPKLEPRINRKVEHGLDKWVGHHGSLSDGQKQLFSLCRLLMRRSKVIVLDEATAEVDLETDKEMQKLFRSEFKDCTILTIAHRLETIMNSDRIIVMDEGRVAEFGPPKELIEQGGMFAELVKANEF
ncbi:Multidrug resistance-associated protein 1 [Coemansia sp. RSA 1200]|nr:Multidrug resistance-associated protein 1 [Coemansia sp. RSA 1200]